MSDIAPRKALSPAAAACAEIMRRHLEASLALFREHGKKLLLHRGETLSLEQLYCLEKGKCALCLNDPRGGIVSIFYHRKGQLINILPKILKYMPLDGQFWEKKIPENRFYVKALSDCELTIIDNDWFMHAFLEDVSISSYVVYSCTLNLVNIYASAYNSPILSNAQRVCRMILMELEAGQNGIIPPHLTHAEISNHLSIHTVTVSKILGKLRKLGIITKQDNVMRVNDPEALRAIADGLAKLDY